MYYLLTHKEYFAHIFPCKCLNNSSSLFEVINVVSRNCDFVKRLRIIPFDYWYSTSFWISSTTPLFDFNMFDWICWAVQFYKFLQLTKRNFLKKYYIFFTIIWLFILFCHSPGNQNYRLYILFVYRVFK